MANRKNFLFDDAPAPLLCAEIGPRQKHHTDCQTAAIILVTGAGNMFDEKVARNFDMDTGAITGHAISINRAAMPDGLQRLDCRIDNSAGRLAVTCGNKSNTAGIMFHVRCVHASCLQPGFIGSPAGKIAVCIKTGFI